MTDINAEHVPIRRKLMNPTQSVMTMVLLVVSILFLFGALARPFVTDDALIYAVIGKAIFTKGLLPFTYIFDHKPILTYYIYGLIALAGPDYLPKWQIFSVIVYAMSAWLTREAAKQESWWVHFLVIVGLSLQSMRFSGNTELIFSPLTVLAVLLILRSASVYTTFWAGVLVGLSININYLSAVGAGPAILYAILSRRTSPAMHLSQLAVGFLGVFAAIVVTLLPLAMSDTTSVWDYFAAQRRFYSGYATQDVARPFWKYVFEIIPFMVIAGICFRCKAGEERTRNAFLIVLVSATIASLISRKNFHYYVYPLVIPTSILWAMSTSRFKRITLIICVLFMAVTSIRSYWNDFGPVGKLAASYDFTQFRKFKSIVGDHPVLSIRGHNAYTYFADVEPAQPLVWPNHAQLFYGPKEDEYFVGYLNKGAEFVFIKEDACTKFLAELTQTCRIVQERYSPVLKIEDASPYRESVLYRLSKPG
jgi:preprotein translocase subunit SecE